MLRYAAVAASLLVPSTGRAAEADTGPPGGPSKAVVAGGSVFTVQADRSKGTLLWARLNGTASGRCDLPPVAGWLIPNRWDIAFGRFWDASYSALVPDSWQRIDHLETYHLAGLLRGEVRRGSDAAPGDEDSRSNWFLSAEPLAPTRVLYPTALYFDYLPDSQDSARAFVLVGNRDTKPPYAVKWSFSVHRYRGKWSADRRDWEKGTWTEEESLPHPFTESFHAYAFGDRYAFLTAAGKVYVTTAKPTKGERQVAPWQATADRSVFAAITDADSGKTFFFTAKRGESGRAKGEYVALEEHPVSRPFDTTGLKPGKVDPPLREAFDYSRLLAADGVLKQAVKRRE
jgi:hypothetical protein